jgi:hypothetical protein
MFLPEASRREGAIRGLRQETAALVDAEHWDGVPVLGGEAVFWM